MNPWTELIACVVVLLIITVLIAVAAANAGRGIKDLISYDHNPLGIEEDEE